MAIRTNHAEDSAPDDGVKRAPTPSIGDINNPADVAEMHKHIRASYSEKIRLSEEQRKSKTRK